MTVGELKKKLAPLGFLSMEVFYTWKLQHGEALLLFVQDLKYKLQHTMPDISSAARKPTFTLSVSSGSNYQSKSANSS